MAFIVFEGGEGVGKSTQLELLCKALKHQGIACTLTREPGGTPFAEDIRALFKQVNAHHDAPLPLTELLLVSAARAQHIKKVIQPDLDKGNFVLCDRFLDSTYVYQSMLGKIDKKTVDNISQIILENIMPDLTFVFIADPQRAIERIKNEKKRENDRLDTAQSNIHFKIKDCYLEIFNKQMPYPNGNIPKRVLINANGTIEEIYLEIKTAIFNTLGITL
ncbi:dTMP kinase [Silvanigrella aquatica]|uniref:Thymidylate kinase n=1 Tax=Silvanigrella aquatica TaxID=1915309 RepID=A0A1L4D1A3_9BACT|nr:dTMP kinase [Silvanigrella aquatica]APJ03982.1 dTMP kinase [Silvanigrella aquatica]